MKKTVLAMMMAAGLAWTAAALDVNITYQGALRDEKGAAIASVSTTKVIDFRLYANASDKYVLWAREYSVLLDSTGLFNVVLSDSTGSAVDGAVYTKLEDALRYARQSALYIGLTVKDSAGEILPRQKLVTVPFATYSLDADKASANFNVVSNLTVGGRATVGGDLTVGGNLSVNNAVTFTGAITAQQDIQVKGNAAFVGRGTIPLGGIILWSGTTPPDGWALCDGSTVNGYVTPDLRSRFVVGYDSRNSSYALKKTGGAETVTLTQEQMPSHNHGTWFPSAGYAAAWNGSREVLSYGDKDNGGTTKYTSWAGGGQAHENRPPYYALAFIMRVY